jgi:translation initiation factor IF-2
MSLQNRPPVVTIMGHVDHGKTTLLDYIRQSHVAAKEAGGITQHIGAYQIDYQGKPITFIDTPGHAAFNKMRERGAKVTDFVILVVAANDGVKPQTIESIRHIKESKVSLIVAINKIDLKDVYPDMAKAQLAEHGILVNGYGGSVETIELSAKTGQGVDKLLETISVMAELQDLKADPAAPLKAVVIESSMDPKKGSVASVIVQQGTLKVRQDVETDDGLASGRIRSLSNEQGQILKEVGPGSPAEIIGFKEVVEVGAVVQELGRDYENEEITEDQLADEAKSNIDIGDTNYGDLFEQKPKLKLIVRSDVTGTLEAIAQNLDPESVELIDARVGDVTDGDIELARATGATIIAFHIKVNARIKELAKTQTVKIKYYDIIYHLIEDLQKQMLKLLEPTIDEVVTGEAEILQIFDMKGMRIAGSRVKTGEFKKTDKLHLKRGEDIIADPVIGSMMRGKDQIDNAKAKSEFGITFRNKKLDFQVGDTLIAYKVEDED